MTFSIRLQRLARLDLWQAFEWAQERAPHTAERWFDRFRESIRTLAELPERRPLAVKTRRAGRDVHELLFGHRPNVFRVLYIIDGDIVRVLRIRRGQRRPLTKGEIESAMRDDD